MHSYPLQRVHEGVDNPDALCQGRLTYSLEPLGEVIHTAFESRPRFVEMIVDGAFVHVLDGDEKLREVSHPDPRRKNERYGLAEVKFLPVQLVFRFRKSIEVTVDGVDQFPPERSDISEVIGVDIREVF